MKKLETVNVIESAEDSIIALHAYPDTVEGNKAAELRFWQIARKKEDGSGTRRFTDEQIKIALAHGSLSDFEDGWDLMLVHSD